MKKHILKKILLILIFTFISLNFYSFGYALDLPVNCLGLPGCDQTDATIPSSGSTQENKIFGVLGTILSEGIKWVAVLAVVALMLAGLNLVVAGGLSGEEEKVSNAKKWVLWAMVGVILSVSAWGIINILNNLEIDTF